VPLSPSHHFSHLFRVLPSLFFFLMNRPPPLSPLFPYTTLFRSSAASIWPAVTAERSSSWSCRRRRATSPRRWPSAFAGRSQTSRSEEHTSELQSLTNLVCRLLLEKKKKIDSEPRRSRE